MRTLTQEQLPELTVGLAVLGSGGGGPTTLLELMLGPGERWPLPLHAVADLDPGLPCVAVAFAGSTDLLAERIPGEAIFEPLLQALSRWTATTPAAVCGVETAGLNGLTPLLLGHDLALVDADFMGRALPRLDQASLLVDRVPGVTVVCATGERGTVLIDSSDPADVEHVLRGTLARAGGAAAFAIGGFRVGDLAGHAVTGALERALTLGALFRRHRHEPLGELIATLISECAARPLGSGRVTAAQATTADPMASAVDVITDDGALLRLVARSELLAALLDGAVVATCPEIIVAIDTISRDVLQVSGLTLTRHVTVLTLPPPPWWITEPARTRAISPAAHGIEGLATVVSR